MRDQISFRRDVAVSTIPPLFGGATSLHRLMCEKKKWLVVK